MIENTQKLALVPLTDQVDAAEQLLVYERTAAKILKISIHHFRELVDLSVIPYRLHRGRSKRLFFVDDLRNYVKDLSANYGKRHQVSIKASRNSRPGNRAGPPGAPKSH